MTIPTNATTAERILATDPGKVNSFAGDDHPPASRRAPPRRGRRTRMIPAPTEGRSGQSRPCERVEWPRTVPVRGAGYGLPRPESGSAGSGAQLLYATHNENTSSAASPTYTTPANRNSHSRR